MTLQSIVSNWCHIYKPMLDSPKNRRFYLTDSAAGTADFAKCIKSSLSPCVLMESTVEGGGPITKITRNYPIYFFVKAKEMTSGDSATVAKEEAWLHARNFLSWLYNKHNEELEKNISGDFSMIDLEGDILIQSIGPIQDGWYAVLIQLDRMEPMDKCVDKNIYIEDCTDCKD